MPSLPQSTENTDSQYAIDKDLYDSTVGIRDEMNLITDRLNKMEEHKGDVSEAVYFRVKSDYLTHYDQVKKSFEAKKKEIQKALYSFYQKQKDQEKELQKHKEVLEEAKFRNFLGEFTDKKFKEIENRENADIKRFENILSLIQGNIKQYEDVVGGPVQEPVSTSLPPAPAPEPAASPVKGPQKISIGSELADDKSSPSKPAAIAPESLDEESYDSLEGDYFQADEDKPVSETPEPKLATAKTKMPESSAPISLERVKTEKIRPLKSAAEEPVTSKTDLKEQTPPIAAKAAPKTSAGLGFDDSISSILRSIPLEEEEESPEIEEVSNPTPMPEAIENPPSLTEVEEKPGKAMLLVIEGEMEPAEFTLGENTSMGRSPSNDIVLKEAKISRQHAAINLIRGHYVLVDLKSSNGVYVNGKRIEEHSLQDGDEIAIGGYRILYRQR